MPNLPRSPPGHPSRVPLEGTPNSRINPGAPLLGLPAGVATRITRATTAANHAFLPPRSEADAADEEDEEEELQDAENDGEQTGTPSTRPKAAAVEEIPSNATLANAINLLTTLVARNVAAESTSSRPAFRTPEMKKPDTYDGASPAKLRVFLQQCKLIFSNDPCTFPNDRAKTIYASSYLTGKAFDWIQPYLEVLENLAPDFLMNSWSTFEAQIVTLFGDPNEL